MLLFDLGGTLVHYYDRHQFPGILRQAVSSVLDELQSRDLLSVEPRSVWARVAEEDHESVDHRVRPLEGRLARIFDVDLFEHPGLEADLCRVFMEPIFARGFVYEDAVPALEETGARGFRTAIVSNTPWGSPAGLWQEEVERLGLRRLVEEFVFCRDVGWRKPARQIFEHALEKMRVSPDRCVFIGDDPRWDVKGPEAAGIESVLLDRNSTHSDAGEGPITSLLQIWNRLERKRDRG